MSQNILDRILETKRKEVAALLQRVSLEELRAQAGQSPRPRNFFKALSKKPHRLVNLIAEVKRASPSAGLICEDFDPVNIAQQYEQAGADALSVLTDEPYFRGSLDFLRNIRQAVELPILRKDFIIDAAQVYEARAAGADAILLIAAALTPGAMSDLMILAAELKMTALVEVHNVEEMLQVRSMIGVPHAAYSLLGINNRDLTSFHTDLATVSLTQLQ